MVHQSISVRKLLLSYNIVRARVFEQINLKSKVNFLEKRSNSLLLFLFVIFCDKFKQRPNDQFHGSKWKHLFFYFIFEF